MRVVAAFLLVATLAVSTSYGGSGNDSAKGTSSKSSSEPSRTAVCKGCYRGHGVSFKYPAKWHKVDELEAPTVGQWYVAFGFDDLNFIRVYHDLLGQGDFDPDALGQSTPVTAKNLDAFKAGFAALVRQRWKEYGGAMQGGPEKRTIAGRPALQFRATREAEEAFRPVSMMLFVFDGTSEYQLECYHTREARAEIERGCAEFVRTFKVEKR
jgi:hypothetical protein